jgi:hypothetical protein
MGRLLIVLTYFFDCKLPQSSIFIKIKVIIPNQTNPIELNLCHRNIKKQQAADIRIFLKELLYILDNKV